MKITFENHGRKITIDMDDHVAIDEVLDAFITGCMGTSWTYPIIINGLRDKYEELKGDMEL